jgi:retinol dehydrogenase 12
LNTKLDILVNNAGVMHETFQLTPRDKVESHFAISHLGHFVFTNTVLPTIRAAGKGARIVNVTSWAHNHTPKEGIIFDPKRMNRPKGTNWMERYGQSKLANVLFTHGLQKRVGDDIFVNTCHPGIVKSDLGRTALHGTMFGIMCMILNPIMEQPVEYGALTQLYLATSPEIEAKGVRGEYYFPCARQSIDLMNPKAKDDQLVERLWIYSEELVKEKMAA